MTEGSNPILSQKESILLLLIYPRARYAYVEQICILDTVNRDGDTALMLAEKIMRIKK